MITEFDNLSYLIGEEVNILSGIEYANDPKMVTIIDEFTNGVLLEISFPKYKLRRYVSKTDMAVGDIILYNKYRGQLIGSKIAKICEEE